VLCSSFRVVFFFFFRLFLFLFFHIYNTDQLLLIGWSESDSLLSEVVDVAILTDEGVSEDPSWSETSEVEGEERPFALTVSSINDPVHWLNVVLVSSNGDGDRSWIGIAIDEIGFILIIICSANGLGKLVNGRLGSSDEACASVRDDIGGLIAAVRSRGDGVHTELEVRGR